MKNLTQYINESIDYNPNNWPNLKELGNGEFNGILYGNCFIYNEKKYFSEYGVLSMFPIYTKAIINDNDIQFDSIDNCQRPELKELFK